MTALREGENDVNKDNDNQTPGEICGGDEELLKFLEENDLLDIKDELLSSKLKLSHFKQVEKSDLEELCSDLQLSSSQKIRLKHSIKSLQQKMKRKKMKNKLKSASTVLSSKKKNLKNKRLRKYKYNKPEGSNKIIQMNDDDDNIRQIRSKLVIVGEASVGKTTLQKSMMGYAFEVGSKATFAVSSMHKKSQYKYKNTLDIRVDYEIFDTPGLDRFADIITLYLRGALAVIVVYDITNSKSFHKAKWWINYLENHASGYDKIILIANKIDIQCGTKGQPDDQQDDNDSDGDSDDDKDADDDDDDIDVSQYDDIIKQGRLYATERGIAFLEISAKNQENINVLLSWINKQSKKKIAKYPQMIEKKDQAIQLHESLLNGNRKKHKFLDGFDFDSLTKVKCCGLV